MIFNNYVWSLYANSPTGKETIKKYESPTLEKYTSLCSSEINSAFDFLQITFDNGITLTLSTELQLLASSWEINNISEAVACYTSLIEEGFTIEKLDVDYTFIGTEDGEVAWWANLILDVSGALYVAQPEYFLPYFFRTKFYIFRQICELFAINLPPLPKKRDDSQRALYYALLSESLYSFRTLYGLSPAEMCAFLYDFAPHFIDDINEKELPEPSKVWLIKGGIKDNGDFERMQAGAADFISHWQGNIDTRRGDILVMYFLAPYKKISFIARAKSDGFMDPYFSYHNTIWLQSPIRVPDIEFKELNANPILSSNPGVKAHMQGPSGVPFTSQEYDALLKIFASKDFNISTLPRLQKIDFLPDIQLQDEREIEIHLIEPFLKRLGYNDSDWIRQLAVRMGRGERNFPDYVVGSRKEDTIEQSATFVLEAKYRISSRKQLYKDLGQAASYALRLQAKLLAVASLEGLWLSQFKNGRFNPEEAIFKNWDELQESDHFHQIKMIIGKGEIK